MEKSDAIVKGIKVALSNLHPVANAIFTGVTTYRGEMEMRFIKDVIVSVNERVYKLEQRLDKEYIKSEDYMNFLYKTLRMVANDVRKEKLSLFTRIIQILEKKLARKPLFSSSCAPADKKVSPDLS